MKNLALFNFDGTITNKNALIEFIKFSSSRAPVKLGLIRASKLLGLKLGFQETDQEYLLTEFLQDWPCKDFEKLAREFSLTVLPTLITKKAQERLQWHRRYHHEIVIVTMFMQALIEPWATANGYKVIAQQPECIDGKLSGKIEGNVNDGFEKVYKIQNQFNLSIYERIYTYVSSKEDTAMLRLGDEGYINWEPFQGKAPVGV